MTDRSAFAYTAAPSKTTVLLRSYYVPVNAPSDEKKYLETL